ncbi:MAG: hypothetical protein JXA33_19155 [Anaerolineae bacterium]|nr:hypothetical protein [Anaerolineae bacterium]
MGHKYSWGARLVAWGTSWIAPQSVARVPSAQSDSQRAVAQVQKGRPQ